MVFILPFWAKCDFYFQTNKFIHFNNNKLNGHDNHNHIIVLWLMIESFKNLEFWLKKNLMNIYKELNVILMENKWVN